MQQYNRSNTTATTACCCVVEGSLKLKKQIKIQIIRYSSSHTVASILLASLYTAVWAQRSILVLVRCIIRTYMYCLAHFVMQTVSYTDCNPKGEGVVEQTRNTQNADFKQQAVFKKQKWLEQQQASIRFQWYTHGNASASKYAPVLSFC